MKFFSKLSLSLILILLTTSCGIEEAQKEEETPTNQTTGTGTGTETALNGSDLYASNCAACHGDLNNSAKTGSSPGAISNAISTEFSMNNISLSNAEINAISSALN